MYGTKKQVKALIDLHKTANQKVKKNYKSISKSIESVIHKKILLEQLTYAAQQIALQPKFNIKDLNEVLNTYNQTGSLNFEVLKASLLNMRNTLSILKSEQIVHINALIKKLNSQLKNI